MILQTYLKQPREDKDYDVDFTPWLTPMGDSLDNVEVEVVCIDDAADTAMIVDRVAITTDMMKLWAKGGTDGYAYKVTIKAFTVGGRMDESELIFAIGEI